MDQYQYLHEFIDELNTVLFKIFTFQSTVSQFRSLNQEFVAYQLAVANTSSNLCLLRDSAKEHSLLGRLRVASLATDVNLADKPVLAAIAGGEARVRRSLLVQGLAEVGVRTVESNLSVGVA